MLRRSVAVCAFLMILSALMAGSLRRVEGQAAAAPAAPAATAKADDASVSPKVRAITEDSKPYVSDRHVALGLECKDCHGDAEPKKPVPTDKCLECHTSFEELSKKTTDISPNPHSNHLVDSSDIDCNYCHHGHKANEIGCRSCHADRVFIRGSATAAK